jgi:hypothetical protein
MEKRCGRSTLVHLVQTMVVVLPLLTLGCDTATGGGWIPGLFADRATFGFTVQCRDTRQRGMPVAVLSSGELDWTDGFVSFHGVVDSQSFEGQTCEEFDNNLPTITFTGTYSPHQGVGSGTFTATVFDSGEPGTDPPDGDTIEITTTGTYTYQNGGPIQGGNIQVS